MSIAQSNENRFVDGQTYMNVYFLKIDASGHSNIVARNASDIVDRVFDYLESTVFSTVEETKKLYNCQYAHFWGWEGDGGLCVIFDDNESVALRTAIESATNILDFKLESLQRAVARLNARGELRLRLAIHRGTFTYKGYERHGSIHSKDLNFVSHLEGVTPSNSLTISREVYQRCPEELSTSFKELPFQFKEMDVFVYSKRLLSEIAYEWLNRISIAGSVSINLLTRRYSETDKSKIIRYTQNEVIDLGTALRTCSQYLVSTARPAIYRSTVEGLLDKGVNYVCLALNPDAPVAKAYADARQEPDLVSKIHESISKMETFASQVASKKGSFELYLYMSLPHFAAILTDRKQQGLLLYAPYLPNLGEQLTIQRADSPHLVISGLILPTFYAQVDRYVDALLDDPETKRII